MKITLDKVVAGAEGSLGGRDPGLSGIPAFEGCRLRLSRFVGRFQSKIVDISFRIFRNENKKKHIIMFAQVFVMDCSVIMYSMQ